MGYPPGSMGHHAIDGPQLLRKVSIYAAAQVPEGPDPSSPCSSPCNSGPTALHGL